MPWSAFLKRISDLRVLVQIEECVHFYANDANNIHGLAPGASAWRLSLAVGMDNKK
jgi:hypothetical protein